MKRFMTYPLALAMLGAGLSVHNADALRRVWFDDPFFMDPFGIIDFENFREQYKQYAAEFGPSKEDREAIKNARERLAKIKYTVTDSDNKVTIQFSGFEKLDKKDIDIRKKDGYWEGTIPTVDGKFKFIIAENGIQVDRFVEIKKEDKDKKDRVSYMSSLEKGFEYFKQHVDIQTIKAEPVKDNTLTITIEKQKEEILPIP